MNDGLGFCNCCKGTTLRMANETNESEFQKTLYCMLGAFICGYGKAVVSKFVYLEI